MMKNWLDEHLGNGYKVSIETNGILEQADGPFPIELHSTDAFGKVLYMGDHFMTSSKDEFVYHELMVHPALCVQRDPKRVLVIGGGDGGAVEEVLKHPSVTEVVLVEIDENVVDFSHRHLKDINKGAFKDPRVNVIIADGYEHVMKDGSLGRYDAIILDLTDPEGPAARLYEPEYFAACKWLLKTTGTFVLHLGPVWTQPERVATIYRNARTVFKHVRPFMSFVPLYGTIWTFALCRDVATPDEALEVARALDDRRITDLKYYDGVIHEAMFALPRFVREILGR